MDGAVCSSTGNDYRHLDACVRASYHLSRLGLPQLIALFAAILLIWWIDNRRGMP